jgi:hypothetical protein
MSPKNLSIVLAPNLFGVPNGFDTLASLWFSQRVAYFLEILIRDAVPHVQDSV